MLDGLCITESSVLFNESASTTQVISFSLEALHSAPKQQSPGKLSLELSIVPNCRRQLCMQTTEMQDKPRQKMQIHMMRPHHNMIRSLNCIDEL